MTRLDGKCILIALTLCIASCGLGKPLNTPSLEESHTTPSPPSDTLQADNEHFNIELGPEWRMEREGASYIFNDEKELRQITIAVLRPNSSTTAGLERQGRESIRMRQEALKTLSRGNITFSDIKLNKVVGGYDLGFSATDQLNEVKIRSVTFARPQRIVTVSFNKYSPFPSDEQLDRQLLSILARIKLKD